MSGLRFQHPGESTIRDLVKVSCESDGVTATHLINAAVGQRIAELRPLLDENPNLHGEPLRDLIIAKAPPAPGPELEERNRTALAPVRMPVYRTEKQALELAARTTEHLKAHQPVLFQHLQKGGASTPAVTRRLLQEQAER